MMLRPPEWYFQTPAGGVHSCTSASQIEFSCITLFARRHYEP